METRGSGRGASQASNGQKQPDYDSAMFRMQALPLPGGAAVQQPTRADAQELLGRDLDDDQLFSMIMELDMAPLGGSHLHMGGPDRRGGFSGGEDSNRDDEDGSSDRPRVTGMRSARGRARRKGRPADEADESSEEEDDEGSNGSGGRGGGKNKRVLANRQSAQRSRMRKLQFISDLENNVSRLQADIKGLNPALAALRARHEDLAAEHEEMRAHAVTLVQKCRQAETVNGALQRECTRLRAATVGPQGGYEGGYGGGRGNYNNGLQSVASAPVNAYNSYCNTEPLPLSHPAPLVSPSAGLLQVGTGSGEGDEHGQHMMHRPSSAPVRHFREGGAAFSPMYMHSAEPLAF